MKNLFYIFIAIVFTTSCRSIDKMVESGNYDEAIIFAAEKLHGKKKKKTKYVKGLEKAFAKVTKADMEHIAFLNADYRTENWDRVYSTALKIKSRQDRIAPFLPLISKDGYRASFEFVRTNDILEEASRGAAQYHYARAESLLTSARTGEKMAAREAYSALHSVKDYHTNFKNTDAMIDEALDLGRTHVLIGVENASGAFIPGRFNEIITSIDVTMLNSRWKVFHVDENYPGHFDYKATFKITGLDVSPERETIERYTDEKEVKDGWRYVLDENGNVAKDTLGNDIKEDNWVIVRANVVEIHREKGAIVRGQLEYTNTLTGDVIRSIPVTVESVFEDYASTFNGDRRALCDRSRRRLKDRPLPFPPDHAMIIEASEELKAILADKLSRTHI